MDRLMEFARRRRTFFATLVPLLLWIFGSPTPARFLAGLPPILLGQALRIWSAGYIHKNRAVATGGPYAYVRNPLYFGSFLIALGFAVMANRWWAYLVTALQFLFFYSLTILSEERFLTANLGETYLAYHRQVPRFWPTGRRHPRPEGEFGWGQVASNKEYRSFLPVAFLCLLFALKAWFWLSTGFPMLHGGGG